MMGAIHIIDFQKAWYAPAFASLLQNRSEGLAIVGAAALQLGLHLADLPTWACPIKNIFGIPCPGCGLTTAIGQLARGDWAASFHTHAFAPYFVFAFSVMAVVLLLPERERTLSIAWIEKFEKQTGITAWFLVLLLLYWSVRLAGIV